MTAMKVVGGATTRRDRNYSEMLTLCRDYVAAQGDLLVPLRYSVGGVQLGSWISYQRKLYRAGKLSQEKILQLEGLGMAWSVRSTESAPGVGRGMVAARAFFADRGHLKVPGNFVCDDGFGLGRWIAYQRGRRTKGTLPQTKIAVLDAIGMVWGATAGRRYRKSELTLTTAAAKIDRVLQMLAKGQAKNPRPGVKMVIAALESAKMDLLGEGLN